MTHFLQQYLASQSFLNSSSNWGPSSQAQDPEVGILIQTTKESYLIDAFHS